MNIDKNIYFKDKNDKIVYNELCQQCKYKCKQSFRVEIINCKFLKEQKTKRKGK